MLQHGRHVEPTPSPTPDPAPALRALIGDGGPLETFEYLGCGSANPHWRVRANGRDMVWRQFGDAALAPGADRAREAAAHRAIAGRSWAPHLIAEVPGVGMLFEASPGRHPDAHALAPAERASLIEAVIECWSLPCPLPALDYAALVEEYVRLAGMHEDARRLGRQLQAACRNWPRGGFCLVHHDLHAGNLLLSQAGWTLLDWEYAARGHPGLDAAALDLLLVLQPLERQQLNTAAARHVGALDWAALAKWRAGLDALWHFARGRDESDADGRISMTNEKLQTHQKYRESP